MRDEGWLRYAVAGASWLAYALHVGLTFYAVWKGVWPLPLSKVVSVGTGSVLSACGLTLYVAAAISFRSVARMSGMRSERLVVRGVYRWSRNPQSVGWGLVLLGGSLLGRSALALAMTALYGLITRLIVPLEERNLEQLFGNEYRQYRSRTARYLGLPKKTSGTEMPVTE